MRKNKIIHLANGGSTITPNIIRGGQAIDLGNNFYYIKGRKHSSGGVDVGKDLEVEGGEVMQMKPNEVRVFSSVPFLRAGSPAELVLGGANPDAVFNAQESFKDRNRIKDDGSKYKCGGRSKAEWGILDELGDYYNILKHNVNAGINYVKRKFSDEEKPNATIIRLNNKKVSRITPNTNNAESILFNDFVENNPNNIRKAKDFKNTSDVLIGDKKIPLNKISYYYGIENDKLKVGDINNFNDTTTIIPVRNKNIGKIKKIIVDKAPNDSIDYYKNRLEQLTELEKNESDEIFKKYANDNNIEPSFMNYTALLSGTDPKVVAGREAYIRKYKYYPKSKYSKEKADIYNRLYNPVNFITENNDTINAKTAQMSGGAGGYKIVLGNEKGNSYFINGLKDIDKKELDKLNKEIENNPVYPVMVDNGRYSHFYENTSALHNYNTYTANDFYRDPKNIFVVGTKKQYGGNMIASINGNVKNGLIHTMKCGGRKKAKVGTGFRINNNEYKIGDTFDYKGQNYIVNDRNEAVPVSADLSKANPDGITNAIKAVDWLKTQEKYIPDTITISNKSTNKSANNTSNTNTISIPQLNVGNIGTYFYNPETTSTTSKTTSTTTKRTVGSNAKSTNNLVKPIVDNTSLAVPYTQPDKISIPRYTEDVYKRPSLASMAKEIEDVDTINLTRQYTKPNAFNRFTDWFNNNLDKINLYSNLGGSAIDFISSAIINSKMPTVDLPTMTAPTLANLPEIKLAEIKDLEAPATVAAAKLKTRYNANPQLAKIEDETRRTMNEIDRNTSSSRVALARKQRAAIQSQEAKNQVYGQKENIETELMNKDRLNAQQVAQANAATYNQFLTARAQQAMQKAQLKMMVDKANISNKLAVDQFNANSKLAVDQFNTNNLIKELLFNNNVRTTQLGNYAAGIGNLFSNIGGSLNNYMINRNARLRDEEVLRSLRARYKEIPQEIMDYILNK